MPLLNIVKLFQEQASQSPERIALDTGKVRCSYDELEKRSARVASMFSFYGLKAGDKVLVFQPMSIELYEVLLGIFRCGLVAVFADPQSGRKHLRDCCIRSEAKAFVGMPKAHWLRLTSWALWKIPVRFSTGRAVPGAKSWQRLDQFRAQGKLFEPDEDAPALITFTSGSTGRPKAAVRTHNFLIAQNIALQASIHLESDQLDLTTLPIFVLANLAAGVTSIVPDADIPRPGFINAKPVIEQIINRGIERSAGSPAFYQQLVNYAEQHKISLGTIKQVYLGGAPVFPSLLQRLKIIMPSANVVAVYGSTEAEPIAHVQLKDISSTDLGDMNSGRGLLTGIADDSIQLAIVDFNSFTNPNKQLLTKVQNFTSDEFKKLQVPLLEVGEIVVSGNHVLQGYLNGEGDAATKFEVDGQRWHRTGDSGYQDSKKRLWLMGRCDARIEDSKGVLYPFTVECAAMQCDGVERAALVSFEGRRLLLLQMQAVEHTEMSALHHLFEWAELDEVQIVKKIPVDQRHNAKVNYPELLDLLRNKRLN